jgi:hypothetical protein
MSEIDPEAAKAIIDFAREKARESEADEQLDVCPICSARVILRHGHTVCVSAMCRERVIDGCCGE